MGDAKRRRDAEGADPLAAAVARVEDACRHLALETAALGANPGAMLEVLYRHVVALLASIEPPGLGAATAADLAGVLEADVKAARERAVEASRRPPGPEETVP